MGPPVKWQSTITPYRTPVRDRSTCSRRATRELRDVLRERLRRELDALRECQVRMEGRGEVVDREPEPGREGRLGDHLPGFGRKDVRAMIFLVPASATSLMNPRVSCAAS